MPVDDLFNSMGEDPPTGRGKCSWGIGLRNATYRKNEALQCGCSVPGAERLDSYAVGIAQLAHTVGKSILCYEGACNAARPKLLSGGLVLITEIQTDKVC